MRHKTIFSVLILACLLWAGQDTIPGWMDTIPPIVKVVPEKQYHNRIFHITLKSSEEGTIWISEGSKDGMKQYVKPLTVMNEGRTTVYFYAEDLFGNRSALDSMFYMLDATAPELTIKPDTGRFSSQVTVRFSCNEPCRFFRQSDPEARDMAEIPESLVVSTSFIGHVVCEDLAGNRTQSGKLVYVVDTSAVAVSIEPEGGIYRSAVSISFRAGEKSEVFYTLDPLAPTEWFISFKKPVELPYGNSLVRYYAKDRFGRASQIEKAAFVIDTVSPRIRIKHREGAAFDTLSLIPTENADIAYSLEKDGVLDGSVMYDRPFVKEHRGRFFIKARAKDKAGNLSELFEWEFKYDSVPPVIRPTYTSGRYIKPFTLSFATNEPVKIFYTMDNTSPNESSTLFKDGIIISKKGVTRIRYFGVDEAGNRSREELMEFNLDEEPPNIRARIEGNIGENDYKVVLSSNEPARIYYELGEKMPGLASPVFKDRISMRSGQTLRYFAVDSAGNRSDVFVMNELQKPMVNVIPEGGVYNRRLKIRFETNMPSDVYWRILPDTVFERYNDTLLIDEEGTNTLEYYSVSHEGLKSPFRRNEYVLDWTAPHVEVSLRKGANDSVIVFFDCSENATIYYTVDGSSPLFSRSTRVAANKFLKSEDRISVFRSPEAKLAFFAEDVAGNQSAVSILDVFKPRAVPNIPEGPDRLYNRILSISFNTYDDKSHVYYERHAKVPTLKSPVYSSPITLLQSDTIIAFVVDLSGYRGDLDTFVYNINLPPSPYFSFSSDTADVDAPVTFNASKTVDNENPAEKLMFCWDFNGDGVFDVKQKGNPVTTHAFKTPGRYEVVLEVTDPSGQSAKVKHDILVRDICPKEMSFVIMPDGGFFCIDRYEWPNRQGAKPVTGTTWIRAKMHCLDAGKRLCTAREWRYACEGGNGKVYPYGNVYKSDKCPSEGEDVFKSGHFSRCGEGFGLFDMIGNVWEWVEDKKDNNPFIMGGSFQLGRDAFCGKRSVGTYTTESSDVGFRCCK